MANLDFAPLYRSTIGFDHVPQILKTAMRAGTADGEVSSYNLEKLGDDWYKLVLSVPGFGRDDIEIVAEPNQLTVTAVKHGEDERKYLHRGFVTQPFKRSFALADYVEVVGAELENGLLVIELKREIPDRLKPRHIQIGSSASTSDTGKTGPKRKKAAMAA